VLPSSMIRVNVLSGAARLEAVPLDEVEKYWDERPCNIRHSPAPVGTRRYFDDVEARKYFVEPHIPAFANFPRWRGKKVLEIGCGIGTDTINFARAGASVTAIDLSTRSLEIAQKRAEVFDLQNRIEFVECSAEDLSAISALGPFDLVYSFGVLHHTPHPARALREIRTVIHESSTFKLMVYNRASWKVGGILLKQGWEIPVYHRSVSELIARYSEAQTGCPVTYSYTRESLTSLLVDAGFSVEDVFVDHIFPYRVKEYRQYRYLRTIPLRWLPLTTFRRLESAAGWHLCATAQLPS
jgi:ubiquinone/menaquinone biosynthesis C-methylase UbiE